MHLKQLNGTPTGWWAEAEKHVIIHAPKRLVVRQRTKAYKVAICVRSL
jgi:hypothetical protein